MQVQIDFEVYLTSWNWRLDVKNEQIYDQYALEITKIDLEQLYKKLIKWLSYPNILLEFQGFYVIN